MAARRGDVIRCTVMFGDEEERDGEVHVPVVFSVNGSRIVPKEGDQTHIEYRGPLYPYIAFNLENSVLAKVRITISVNVQCVKTKLRDCIGRLLRIIWCLVTFYYRYVKSKKKNRLPVAVRAPRTYLLKFPCGNHVTISEQLPSWIP